MAFNKRTWKGRQGTGLNKFSINGATPVPVVNQPDSVTEQGDALSAGNLNDLEDRIYDGIEEEATARSDADSNLKSAIEGNSQRIENLEVAVSGSLVQTNILTDPPSMANTRTITNANEILPWAILKRVGARAVAWNQLFKIATGSEHGISITTNDGGQSYIINGTADANVYFRCTDVSTIVGHVYYVETGLTSVVNGLFIYNDGQGVKTYGLTNRVATATGVSQFYLRVNNGTQVNNVTIKPHIHDLTAMNEASLTADQFRAKFPASYYPYNAGQIIPLNPSAFKVVGKNKNNNANNNIGSYWTTSGVAYASGYASTERIKAVPLGTYIGSLFNKTTNARVANVVYTTFNSLDDTKALRQVTDATITLVAGENYISIRNYGDNSAYITADNFLFQLEIGSTASAYGLYTETTIDTSDVPEGYVDSEHYNYKENILVDGVMRGAIHGDVIRTKVMKGTDGGWGYEDHSSDGYYLAYYNNSETEATLPNYYKPSNNYEIPIMADGANAVSRAKMTDLGTIPNVMLQQAPSAYLLFSIPASMGITSSSAFNSWLSNNNVTIFYRTTEESQTITYTEPIPNIPCEDGTTVTAVTPQTDIVNAIDVPSTIAYMTKIGG